MEEPILFSRNNGFVGLGGVRAGGLNLVNNALKFTERGRVSVTVNRLSNADGEWTEVHVADTGIGIAPQHLAKLFQPFSQVDGSATRKYDGTGLGLAISQKFCRMMGGDITVESASGRGSRFSIRLPLAGPRRRNDGRRRPPRCCRAAITPARAACRRRAGS